MNNPYLLIPIGIVVVILYSTTMLLNKLDLINLKTHRRIWNLLLFFTFFTTALLGLLLALQVNYKLAIPTLKKLLTIHVDFGIAMSIIAVFHFFWHWDYYGNILKKNKSYKSSKSQLNINQHHTIDNSTYSTESHNLLLTYIQVFALGFASTLVQIVLMREFMFIFGGNELIIGVILANWMVLTGLGAYLGKSARPNMKVGNARRVIFFVGWIPPVLLFIIEFFRNLIFKPGVEIGFLQIVLASILILAPFCLLSGFLFTHLAGTIGDFIRELPAEKAYSIEAFGSLIAGILISFVFFYFLSNLQIMVLIPLFISVLLLFPIKKQGITVAKIFGVIAAIACAAVTFMIRADYLLKRAVFTNQQIIYLKDTPFGNLAVTKIADQLNIYDNGKLLFSTENQAENEEAVHFAMAQHPNPQQVLLIAGGISGITNEILKYNVRKIDYIEINPVIFKVGKLYTTSLRDPRIHTINQDARLFARETRNRYDIVLINLPEPSTAQLNRYFTLEFLNQLKNLMYEHGILSLSLPSTANYISDEAIQLNSVIFNTCKKVFKEVLIIPGERNYYLLSEKPLIIRISQLIENKNIKNTYLNSYYLDESSLQQRSDYILDNLRTDTMINKDFRPISYFYYLGYWLSQFNLSKNLLWAILMGLVLLLIGGNIFVKPVTSALMISGFSASSVEILLLLALQVMMGYLYQVMGLCIAVFMGGIALGALCRNRVFRQVTYGQLTLIQIIMGSVILITPAILGSKSLQQNSFTCIAMILLLMFIISLLSGVLFSLSIQLRKDSIVGNIAALYSIDLIGSALGAFITSIFLIPLLGIMNTFYLTGIILILYAFILLIRKKYWMKNHKVSI
jgi:spermidine synthase